jgi:hypothetical protein
MYYFKSLYEQREQHMWQKHTTAFPTKGPASCLGGVMVSVLATGPKGCGFEPGQGDGFFRTIKIHSTPSSRMGSKAQGPMS